MSEIVDLDAVRARTRRDGAVVCADDDGPRLEDLAPQHPALRWVAGEMWWAAHRRDPASGGAACGAPGALILAPPGVPLCPVCYPPRPDGP